MHFSFYKLTPQIKKIYFNYYCWHHFYFMYYICDFENFSKAIFSYMVWKVHHPELNLTLSLTTAQQLIINSSVLYVWLSKCRGGFKTSRQTLWLTFRFISVRLDQSLFRPLPPFSISSSCLSLFFRSSLNFGISLDETFWLDSTVTKNNISVKIKEYVTV